MSDGGTALRFGTWNTNWAKPGTERGRCVSKRLDAPGCDLLCVTEGYAGILPAVDREALRPRLIGSVGRFERGPGGSPIHRSNLRRSSSTLIS